MLIRLLMGMIALAALWGIHAEYPWIEVSSLVFLATIAAISAVVPQLAKPAIGTLVIFLAYAIAFVVSSTLRSFGIDPMAARFELVSTVLVPIFVGLSSGLLCIYASYSVWQLIGSLVVFVGFLFLHFHSQEPRLQGAGLVLGLLAGVPWIVGLLVGVVVCRHVKRSPATDTSVSLKH